MILYSAIRKLPTSIVLYLILNCFIDCLSMLSGIVVTVYRLVLYNMGKNNFVNRVEASQTHKRTMETDPG